MCYALEDFCRVHQLRECVSSTSLLQTWNQPRKRTLEATEIRNIKFVKLEYGKQKRTPNTISYDPCPIPLQHTSTKEVQLLRQSLEHKGNVRDMFNHCDIMVTMLTPSLEDIVAIEKATRRQHESKRWYE